MPASFFVICHVRRKLACSCCETIVQAPVPSRPIARGIHLQTHLVHFSGVLQADAYARVIAFYVDGMIQEAACWAHARHNFYGLHSARPSAITTETLRRIAELYVIEAEIRGKAPDELQRVRQQRSRPLLDDFDCWLRATLEKFSRKSDTRRRSSTLNLWSALLRYFGNGIIAIDNSAAERALRGVAIGRRNHLFTGADSGGEGAAAIYLLIGTAKLNGDDSEAWLRHVLANIADHPIIRSTGSPTSCPGLRRASTFGLNNTPPPRGDAII